MSILKNQNGNDFHQKSCFGNVTPISTHQSLKKTAVNHTAFHIGQGTPLNYHRGR